jgi:hypothetical protein
MAPSHPLDVSPHLQRCYHLGELLQSAGRRPVSCRPRTQKLLEQWYREPKPSLPGLSDQTRPCRPCGGGGTMRTIPVLLLCGCLAGCAVHQGSDEKATRAAVREEAGKDGSSIEKALLVREKTESTGIAAEYQWLAAHYPGYKMIGTHLKNSAWPRVRRRASRARRPTAGRVAPCQGRSTRPCEARRPRPKGRGWPGGWLCQLARPMAPHRPSLAFAPCIPASLRRDPDLF